ALTATDKTITPTEGASFSGVVASFTDADPNGTRTDYSATINWGDGHTSVGTIAANGSGGFDVSGTNTYAKEGPYAVSVSIADHGASDAASSTANVADAVLTASGGTLSGTEGAPVPSTTVVAHFSDADPHGLATDYSATVDWKDGSSSAGVIVANSGGGFDVQAGHIYEEEGSYPIHVSIADLGGSTANADGSLSVADAALIASDKTLTATEGAAITSTTVVADFTDADQHGSLGDYTANIEWKDGTSNARPISTNAPYTTHFRSGHIYEEEGSYPIHVSIADLGGSTVDADGSVSVGDAALIASGKTLTATEGAAI